MSPAQFGFLRGRSTVQYLLLFFRKINKSVDSISQIGIVYLDLSKAFDNVPHNELLLKLNNMGVCVGICGSGSRAI